MSESEVMQINPGSLDLAALSACYRSHCHVTLMPSSREVVDEAAAVVSRAAESDAAVYGVNTGFGQLASVRIGDDELAHLQENLVRSHAVGVGEDLDDNIVRLIMLMKVIGLAEGFSGVRLELVERLCDLINHTLYPCIP